MSRFKGMFCILKSIYCPVVLKSTKKCSLGFVNSVLYNRNCYCTDAIAANSMKNPSVTNSKAKADLSAYGPLVLPSFNLAAYANESPLLQEFIKLGVEIYKFDKNPKIGEYLLKLDFEKNVKPYLVFLHDNGVAAENLGKFITKNPFIFQEDLNDLQVRINYLQSKKFERNMISEILTKTPQWLSFPVTYVDERLGYLQQTFKLSGDQVRSVITLCPNLMKVNKKHLLVSVFTLKEEMDLDDRSLKKIFLASPTLLKKKPFDVISTYDYLTRTMKVTKCLIIQQPMVLTCRKFLLIERHKFLETLGRAQYNPIMPGYVSLKDLVLTTDEVFCEKIAKTSIHSFNDFLKTI